MSPRPRKASDDEIYAAAYRAMQRLTPAQLTLAAIAREAGVTAGALVQRFGSKRELMLRLMQQFGEATPSMFGDLRARHESPLAALRAYALGMAHMGETPAALAHHLSYLQLDFTDPDFHEHAKRQALLTQAALESIVDDARARGELLPTADAPTLARLVQAIVAGALLSWGFLREGSAVAWVARDVDALLAPWVSLAQKA